MGMGERRGRGREGRGREWESKGAVEVLISATKPRMERYCIVGCSGRVSMELQE